MSPDGSRVYVANYAGGSVSVINTSSNTVIATVTGLYGPTDVAVSPDGSRVYVANNDSGTVGVINTASNTVIATVSYYDALPSSLVVSPDGSRVYVVDSTGLRGDNTLTVINTASNTVIARVFVGEDARRVAVSPDGSRVYVSNGYTSTVRVISTASNTVIATVSLSGFAYPEAMAVSPDGSRVYVTHNSDTTVSVIDTTSNTVIETVGVGYGPLGVAVSPDGSRVYVVNSGDSTVSVISTASNTVIETLTDSDFVYPHSIAVSPDGSRLYMTNTEDSSVSVIQVGPSVTTPSAPTSLIATPGNGSVSLAFTAGADGGASISKYQYQLGSGSWTDAVGTTSPITVSGLTNGTSYSIKLRAVNSAGDGAASDASGSFTPRTTPSAPTSLVATPGSGTPSSGSVSVAFAAGSDGGASISKYQYQLGSGDWVDAVGTTSPISISGLTNGTSYDIKLRAVNSAGPGDASAASSSVTPVSVPGAPTWLWGIPRDGHLIAHWSAPSSDGGSPITGYTLEIEGGEFGWWNPKILTTCSPGCVVIGLTNGSFYRFTVTATNAIGDSETAYSVGYMPAGPPGLPSGVYAVRGDESATIYWTAATDNNFSEITNYTAQAYTTSGSEIYGYYCSNNSVRYCTITGLTNGTDYRFAVRAENEQGWGSFTALTAPIAPSASAATTPGAPSNVVITPGNSSVSVSFTASDNNGATISKYQYQLGSGSWTDAVGTTSPISISGLTNGTSYDIKLRAVNSVGDGAASDAVSVTPRTVPGAPSITSVTPGDSTVSLAFTAGADGGSVITGYEYELNGSGSWFSLGTTSSPASIGVTNGVSYTVKLRAVNSAGSGEASAEVSFSMPDAPDAPTSLSARRGYGSAEISFTAGADGGAAITKYQYSTNDGANWTDAVGTSSPITISGLTNGTTYSIKLRAANVIGDGAPSDAVSVTPAVVDAASWTARDASEANAWISVTYGNGVFVAVAANGSQRVMTSSDGETWTARNAAEANPWSSVTFGNGVFVAVSFDGSHRVMTSSDGVTWTARNAAEANYWNSVTFGNGVFVAVARTGTNRVMTSPDGVTWTARNAAEANSWMSVTFGNGVFVAVSFDGSHQVMTSPDGVTWTSRDASAANPWMSVTSGNGVFVAVSYQGFSQVMTSPDGVTWTAREAAVANSSWTSVTSGNGLFVAVAEAGTHRVMTSPDGVTWTERDAPEANSWYSVTYGEGMFAAVSGAGSHQVMISSFTTLTPDAPTSLVGIPDDGAAIVRFSAGTNNGGAITKYQYTTDDGDSWADTEAGTTSPVRITGLTNGTAYSIKLRAVNGVGHSDASPAVSVTPSNVGVSWTASSNLPTDEDWTSVVFDGATSLFVAVSDKGSVQTSSDGSTWSARSVSADHVWTAITVRSLNSMFVAVGADGAVMSSADGGLTWEIGESTGSHAWRSVTFRAGVFVAVGDDGYSMTSTDGENWSVHGGPTGHDWKSVTVRSPQNTLVAVASDGAIATSSDGVTWNDAVAWPSESAAPTPSWSSVTFREAGNDLVAVALDGSIARSSDGSNWYLSSSHATHSWTAVRGCQGFFIALSSDGANRVATSFDGEYWLSRSAPVETSWSALTCAAGVPLAVARSTGAANSSMISGSWPVPLAPTGIVATPGNGSGSFSYTAGSTRVSGSPSITELQYQLNGVGLWRTFSSISSPKVTGLRNGTTYTIRLRGKAGSVIGYPSVSVSFTPVSIPTPARVAVLDAGGAGSVTIHWAAPQGDGGSAITNYVYIAYLSGTTTRVSSCSTASTSCTISGLTAGVAYDITGGAFNAIGRSLTSAKLSIGTSTVTSAKPSAPTFTSITDIGSGKFRFVLGAPAANGSAITAYRVIAHLSNGTQTAKYCLAYPLFRTCTISGLTPGATYSFRATALNALGRSSDRISSNFTVSAN
jgi:titin